MNRECALDGFIAAASNRGLIFEGQHPISDGRIHRVPVRTASGRLKKNGWYVLFGSDRPVAAYGRHDDGIGKDVWFAETERRLSWRERQEMAQNRRRQMAVERLRREREYRNAVERAAEIILKAKPATSHPYLSKKGVKGHGVYVYGRDLIIPIRDRFGRLMSVEKIGPDGAKWYLKGGKKAGGFHLIGDVRSRKPGIIFVAEGYATAATVHECTGQPVAVAFDCENLFDVAWALHWLHRKALIVVCADDDWRTSGNPGVTKANVAARAARGCVAIPVFPEKREPGDTDFNDMARLLGREAVREVLREAVRKARKPRKAP